jgi:hypothetical protein
LLFGTAFGTITSTFFTALLQYGGLLLAGLLQHLSSSFDVQVSNPVGGKTGGEVIWNKLVGSEMASHTMVRNWHILHIHCLDLNQYLISHFLQMLY